MRTAIHSHPMSAAFTEHLQGRGTLSATVREAEAPSCSHRPMPRPGRW